MIEGTTNGNVNRQDTLLTRAQLALELKVSLRMVDMMLADGEITPMRLRGKLVRFYLPDVLQELREKAKTSKRGCTRKLPPGQSAKTSNIEHRTLNREEKTQRRRNGMWREGFDDAAEWMGYLVAMRSRAVTQRKLRL